MHLPNSAASIALLCSWDTNEMEPFRECQNEQICPRSNKFSLNRVSRCPIHGTRVLRILAAGATQSCETDELLFRLLQLVFFGNAVFPFWETRSFSSMSCHCQVFMHNKQHCFFTFCAIISLLFPWKAMLFSVFLDITSQRQTLQVFCMQITCFVILVYFVCSRSKWKTY